MYGVTAAHKRDSLYRQGRSFSHEWDVSYMYIAIEDSNLLEDIFGLQRCFDTGMQIKRPNKRGQTNQIRIILYDIDSGEITDGMVRTAEAISLLIKL